MLNNDTHPQWAFYIVRFRLCQIRGGGCFWFLLADFFLENIKFHTAFSISSRLRIVILPCEVENFWGIVSPINDQQVQNIVSPMFILPVQKHFLKILSIQTDNDTLLSALLVLFFCFCFCLWKFLFDCLPNYRDLLILHGQCHGYCWPGDARSQDIW